MNAPHDKYTDLPMLSLGDRMALETMEPAHFALSPEELEESYAVSRAVRALVARYVAHRGYEAVDYTTHRALLAVRQVIEQYMHDPGKPNLNLYGDVTPRD
ncbi:hypothetical protein MABM_22030 [Mycobacteroides abscessus]|uniref:hypothetical protein n=1 Tax=Mycobacteroides abscessus TaxID=36809 RepID=UPI0003A22843|nr:hypothetical protein [Mycobacteroides abscessus]BBZ82287.1 hypothetical protein MABM_22030 [Mycobacteroides abscessus]